MGKKSPVCSLSLIKVLDCTLICFYNKTNTSSLLGNLYNKLLKYLKMFGIILLYIRLNFTTKLDTSDYVKQTVTYLQLGHIEIEDSRYYVKRVTKNPIAF